jgi:phosphoribosylaminoimidazole-succinocarboxamide synthase
MFSTVIVKTDLPLDVVNRGKVRDLYQLKDDLLLIATDRISAFDYVLPSPIPAKGVCLTQLSKFWFEYTKQILTNHMITTDFNEYPSELHGYQEILEHRSMVVKKTKVIPIECIIRGYISGSAWKSYRKDHTVCGIQLPSGLLESERFDEPLFTPSTKADSGHDINISFEEMKQQVGADIAEHLQDYSLRLYSSAAAYAMKRGIIIADTKFEFGMVNDEILLIDEALTPDSSRFWPADRYEPGRSQPSFDKQYVRDYLSQTGWDKNSSPPMLPEQVIIETQRKYQEAFERITGKQFSF